MKILFALLMTVSFFAMGCSHYGKRHGKEAMMMKHWKMMDANGDDVISKEEFDKGHAEHWTKMDADKDGKVTKEEMKAFHEEKKKDCGCGKEGKKDAKKDKAVK